MNIKKRHVEIEPGNDGFTLVELIVVVLIIGISAAVSIPRLAGSLPGVRIKSSARAIAASLRYARSQAVSYQTPYAVVIDEAKQALIIGPKDAETKGTHSPESKQYRPPESIQMVHRSGRPSRPRTPETAILFYASGASSGGRVTIVDLRKRKYAVNVDAITGGVSVEQL